MASTANNPLLEYTDFSGIGGNDVIGYPSVLVAEPTTSGRVR